MTEEEIKKFAKEYVQNNTDESVNSFIGEQLQKAFIEGTDFMYYSNNEELKKELTEAKEIIRALLFHLNKDTFAVIYETKKESIEKAEDFLKENK